MHQQIQPRPYYRHKNYKVQLFLIMLTTIPTMLMIFLGIPGLFRMLLITGVV